MIEPTVGRIVHFRPGKQAANLRIQCDPKQPLAAIVTYVHGARMVNLAVLDALGRHHALASVRLLQDDDKGSDDEPFAEWMPVPTLDGIRAHPRNGFGTFVMNAAGTNVAPAPDSTVEAEIVARGKTAPRVTPADIEATISHEFYFTAEDGIVGKHHHPGESVGEVVHSEKPHSMSLLTFCVLVLRNGFTVTGESACASPENFDGEIGRKIARQNAVQKIWPLEGYLLKQQLHVFGA